jgi:hypothetical protein
MEYIVSTEKLCQKLEEFEIPEDIEKAKHIRCLVIEQLRKHRRMKVIQNLSKEDKRFLNEIKHDKSIVVCPADKGNAIVIEDRSNYMQKLDDQIQNGDYAVCQTREQSIIDNLQKSILHQLQEMKIGKTDRRSFMVTAPTMPFVYLLIKVHKNEQPGRAVVNQIGDPTYKLCEILTNILNPLDEEGAAYLKDSFHLKKMLKEVHLEEDYRLASLDVVALYPSIPVPKALEIVEQRLKNDANLESRTKWSVDQIMKLLVICLETYFKTPDNRIYKQTDGTPIGKSISGPIASIYMNWLEESFVLNSIKDPRLILWKRYRDDVFIIWKGDSKALESYKEVLNNIEPRIKFTMEFEKDGILPFLDLNVKRSQGKITTSIYRKPTHTQLYLHWRSNHGKNALLGTLKSLIHRAHKLIDEKEDLLQELQLLKDVFIQNGYPIHLIEKTIQNSWKIEMMKKLKEELGQEEELPNRNFYDILHAPYIQGFSELLQRQLKPFNVGFVPMKGEKIRTAICNLKPENAWTQEKDVVYGIKCQDCDLPYIGETSQTLKTRLKQHQYAVRRADDENGIFSHLKIYPTHRIDWEHVCILDRDDHWQKRKLKESIIIEALNPSAAMKDVMNLEKGRKTDPNWMVFNQNIREEVNKKLNVRPPGQERK